MPKQAFFEGGCTCGHVRYRLTARPLIVHACHCRHCQRESGGAFALNLLIENNALELIQGEPLVIKTPTESGKGQKIARCPNCHVALWSHYAVANRSIAFVRVGTLDSPDLFPPDVHIFTATKQPWLTLGADVPVKTGYYSAEKLWTKESMERYAALRTKNQQQKSGGSV